MIKINSIYKIFYILCIQYVSVSTELVEFTLFEITAFSLRERLFLYSQYHILEDRCIFGNSVTNEAAVPMQVVVDNDFAPNFEDTLHKYNIKFTRLPILVPTSKEKTQMNSKNYTILTESLTWNETLKWIDSRMALYPFLEKKVVSRTYEKRDLFYLKISKKSSYIKPTVFIMGAEQGRDWISAAVILNLAEQLLTNNASVMQLLDLYDFYMVPIANPDGYHFSMTEDRFWAKNRRHFYTDDHKCGPIAYGVDTDRNWYWAKSFTINNEGSHCNSVYLGPTIFSEQEPKAIFHMINQTAATQMAFIEVKGFAKLITVPYAYNREMSVNHDLMMEILKEVQDKLQAEYNETYFYGKTSSLFYNLTGNAADCVKEKFNVPIVMTIYLKHGISFLPKNSHIEPLTNQFITILNEALMIAYDIYSPLFGGASKFYSHVVFIAVIFIVIVCE